MAAGSMQNGPPAWIGAPQRESRPTNPQSAGDPHPAFDQRPLVLLAISGLHRHSMRLVAASTRKSEAMTPYAARQPQALPKLANYLTANDLAAPGPAWSRKLLDGARRAPAARIPCLRRVSLGNPCKRLAIPTGPWALGWRPLAKVWTVAMTAPMTGGQ